MPRKFRLKDRQVNAVELLDQWFGSNYRYCKIQGSDGAIYILRLNDPNDEWQLASRRASGRVRTELECENVSSELRAAEIASPALLRPELCVVET